MDWHSDDIWLDEYADGAMTAEATRAADAHLATCARCRALVADIRAIRSMSRSLESHVPPPHVWVRLAAAIEAQPKRRWLFSLSPFALQPAAALAMAAVLGTGLWWVGGRLAPAAGPAAGAGFQAPLMTAGVGSVTLQMAEQEFTTAIAGLEEMTTAQQDALDPETVGVMQANLSVIDSAIDQSRAALVSEPESDVAQQSLFEALRSKVALLQNILTLINEMRKGDPEATARIVSGLNQ
jgi:hypothetical protein